MEAFCSIWLCRKDGNSGEAGDAERREMAGREARKGG